MLDIEPASEPLPDKEWHKHLAGLLNYGKLNPEIIEYLDARQQYCVNEIKKYYKRINYKNARQTTEDTEGAESAEGAD